MKLNRIGAFVLGVLCVIAMTACGAKLEQSVPETEPTMPVETQYEPAVNYDSEKAALEITELMAKNRAYLKADNGKFPDWIELHNKSSETISLTGWSLADDAHVWDFPEVSIASDEYLLIYMGNDAGLGADFSISEGDALRLLAPDGSEASLAVIPDKVTVDTSLAADDFGSFAETQQATPGYPNNEEGYELFCSSQTVPEGSLIISEVCAANKNTGYFINGNYRDWIEIKNNSAAPLNLSSFYLSDDHNDKLAHRLPGVMLAPGEYAVIYCDNDFTEEECEGTSTLCVPFSVSSKREQIWLSDENGNIIDYISLNHLTSNRSIGRTDGQNGWFLFETPTPGYMNRNGYRELAQTPAANLVSGQYNDIDHLTIELTAAPGAQIYYTTADSVDDYTVQLYTGPIDLYETSILRAYAVEEGKCRSELANYSYFINTNHVVPIISLIGDTYGGFVAFRDSANKFIEYPGTVAMYRGTEEVFLEGCAIRLKGYSACVDDMKKNYGVYFKDQYNGEKIKDNDLFGSGMTEFSSLLIRAGQDHWANGTLFRNELMQELCLQMTDKITAQHNIYCVLYVNGRYYGIYSLKEDMNREFYSAARGVSKESVESIHIHNVYAPDPNTSLYKLLQFGWSADMTDEENYRSFCERADIDAWIDFTCLQAFSGNIDLGNNIRYFMSPEEDGKWRPAFYDQDQTFYSTYAGVRIIFENYAKPDLTFTNTIQNLARNPDFRDRLLKRYAEVITTTLSNENVLREIDILAAELEPEIAADRAKFYINIQEWYAAIDKLKAFFLEQNYAQVTIDTLCQDLQVTPEERIYYFGQ